MQKSPLLAISFKITPEIYEACLNMIGQRLKQKNMPRMVVLGGLISAFALGFLGYLFFYLRIFDLPMVLLSILLLLIGIYNISYYSRYFRRLLHWRARYLYKRSPYLQNTVTLRFYDEFFDEQTGKRKNRVQWSSVKAVHKEEEYYLLRLTQNSGIIIPLAGLREEEILYLGELIESCMGR